MDSYLNTKKIFNKYADGYEAKYMDVSLYHDSLDLFCENLNKGSSRILEIGCGPGNISRYLLSKLPELDLLGIDIAENMIGLAARNNPEAEFKVMDCREISQLNEKFDGVVCGFCLPYLSKKDAVKLISDISVLLRPAGVVYLSTMEADHNRSGYKGSDSAEEKLYINYHEADDLIEVLRKTGMRILKSFYLENPANEKDVRDLVILAGK